MFLFSLLLGILLVQVLFFLVLDMLVFHGFLGAVSDKRADRYHWWIKSLPFKTSGLMFEWCHSLRYEWVVHTAVTHNITSQIFFFFCQVWVLDVHHIFPSVYWYQMQLREKSWFASSLRSRLQYLGPHPGLPFLSEETQPDISLDPSAGPVDAFCLLILEPDQVMISLIVWHHL